MLHTMYRMVHKFRDVTLQDNHHGTGKVALRYVDPHAFISALCFIYVAFSVVELALAFTTPLEFEWRIEVVHSGCNVKECGAPHTFTCP